MRYFWIKKMDSLYACDSVIKIAKIVDVVQCALGQNTPMVCGGDTASTKALKLRQLHWPSYRHNQIGGGAIWLAPLPRQRHTKRPIPHNPTNKGQKGSGSLASANHPKTANPLRWHKKPNAQFCLAITIPRAHGANWRW